MNDDLPRRRLYAAAMPSPSIDGGAAHLSFTAAVFVKLYDFPIHPSSLSTQFKPLISTSFHR